MITEKVTGGTRRSTHVSYSTPVQAGRDQDSFPGWARLAVPPVALPRLGSLPGKKNWTGKEVDYR